MVKMIIVDDEKMTREGLMECIPWNELGIDCVEAATDGVEALNLAVKFQPNIVLSDVRMPRMDGIELARHLKTELPDCKVIFLSGYSDKEYLKSAIDLQVVNYIEKPINIEEIMETILKTVSLLNKEMEKKRLEIDTQSKLNETISLKKEKLALELLSNQLKPEFLQKDYEFSKLGLEINQYFFTILLKLYFVEYGVHERAIVYEKHCIDIIRKHLESESINFLAGFKDKEYAVVHIACNKAVNTYFIKDTLEKIVDDLRNYFDKKVMIFTGVGKMIHDLMNVYKSYQFAVIATQRQFFTGCNSIVFYEEKNEDSYAFDENLLQQFGDYLREDKKEEALFLIKTLTKTLRKHENTLINNIKNYYFKLLLKLSQVAEERNIHIVNSSDKMDFLWEKISNFCTLVEIEDYIVDKIEAIFRQIFEKYNKSTAVFNIMKFVLGKYQDENLSIKLIAEYTYLTPTYICMIFKKETGKTINQYITEVRIEKAKEYLKDRRIKLYEVASRVGYNDANYFAKTFKKLVNLNPSEFRERYLQ